MIAEARRTLAPTCSALNREARFGEGDFLASKVGESVEHGRAERTETLDMPAFAPRRAVALLRALAHNLWRGHRLAAAAG